MVELDTSSSSSSSSSMSTTAEASFASCVSRAWDQSPDAISARAAIYSQQSSFIKNTSKDSKFALGPQPQAASSADAVSFAAGQAAAHEHFPGSQQLRQMARGYVIRFAGDSVMRHIYFGVASLLKEEDGGGAAGFLLDPEHPGIIVPEEEKQRRLSIRHQDQHMVIPSSTAFDPQLIKSTPSNGGDGDDDNNNSINSESADGDATQEEPVKSTDIVLQFAWRPYIEDVLSDFAHIRQASNAPCASGWTGPLCAEHQKAQDLPPDLVVYGVGLWDLLRKPETLDAQLELLGTAFWGEDVSFVRSRREPIQPIAGTRDQPPSHYASGLDQPPAVLFKSISQLTDKLLKGHRLEQKQFRDEKVMEINALLAKRFVNWQQQQAKFREDASAAWPVYLVDGHISRADAVAEKEGIHDGVHSTYGAAVGAESVAATLRCLRSFRPTPRSALVHSNYGGKMWQDSPAVFYSVIYMAMFAVIALCVLFYGRFRGIKSIRRSIAGRSAGHGIGLERQDGL